MTVKRLSVFMFPLALLLACGPAQAGFFGKNKAENERKERELQEASLKEASKKSEQALGDLEKRYKDLEIDRNNILAQTAYIAPTNKDLDEIEMDSLQIRCSSSGGGFQMYINTDDGSYLADKFVISYFIG